MNHAQLFAFEDDFVATLATTVPYTLVVLRPGPNRDSKGVTALIMRHGNRNLGLQRQGHLPIILPVRDSPDVSGVGVFTTDLGTTRAIMDADPGVQAGVFVYDTYETRSFPGSTLPPPANAAATEVTSLPRTP